MLAVKLKRPYCTEITNNRDSVGWTIAFWILEYKWSSIVDFYGVYVLLRCD